MAIDDNKWWIECLETWRCPWGWFNWEYVLGGSNLIAVPADCYLIACQGGIAI